MPHETGKGHRAWAHFANRQQARVGKRCALRRLMPGGSCSGLACQATAGSCIFSEQAAARVASEEASVATELSPQSELYFQSSTAGRCNHKHRRLSRRASLPAACLDATSDKLRKGAKGCAEGGTWLKQWGGLPLPVNVCRDSFCLGLLTSGQSDCTCLPHALLHCTLLRMPTQTRNLGVRYPLYCHVHSVL